MRNVGNATVAWPSLTRIVMFEYVCTCAVPGVPDRRPVVVEKVAQVGRFVIEKLSVSPLASAAVGWKL